MEGYAVADALWVVVDPKNHKLFDPAKTRWRVANQDSVEPVPFMSRQVVPSLEPIL